MMSDRYYFFLLRAVSGASNTLVLGVFMAFRKSRQTVHDIRLLHTGHFRQNGHTGISCVCICVPQSHKFQVANPLLHANSYLYARPEDTREQEFTVTRLLCCDLRLVAETRSCRIVVVVGFTILARPMIVVFVLVGMKFLCQEEIVG